MNRRMSGFTLIELLIVVAIIAILAAIAVPNFLEAQTRAKVSRARADLRSLATALEAYRIDFNAYPPHRGTTLEMEAVHLNNGYGNSCINGFRTISLRLSSPIAYITNASIFDPFKKSAIDVSGQRYESGSAADVAYGYNNIFQFVYQDMNPTFFPDDFNTDYGYWRIFSLGPNMRYESTGTTGTSFGHANRGWIYDPTNGTISTGYVIRTQNDPQGERLAIPD